LICPPASFIGPIAAVDRDKIIRSSVIYGHYEKAVDRESAYERLKAKAAQSPEAPPAEMPRDETPMPRTTGAPRGRQPDSLAEAMMKSVVRAAGSQMGRSLIRGVLGSILGGRR
jgi:hypothetical protein